MVDQNKIQFSVGVTEQTQSKDLKVTINWTRCSERRYMFWNVYKNIDMSDLLSFDQIFKGV